MTFWKILETLLLGPLKLVFAVIFQLANNFIGHPGFAIIVLSLIMNVLVLPLYRRADAMQEAARDTEAKLKRGVDHIKKSFSGDERMMILQTYYRQNHYKPTQALNGSLSLLLEIPFFMAAYQFLSQLQVMDGVSLGPIADLSKPDGLLTIGGLTINVLPVLMTLINVISSALYLKGFPLKTKIQLYGMALFFLVFLYTSPACLVFYWTLNNTFSLVKTIFYKLKNPRKVLNILLSVLGLALFFAGIFMKLVSFNKNLFLMIAGGLLQLPLLWAVLKEKLPTRAKNTKTPEPKRSMFLLGGLLLTVLIGLYIPSMLLAVSPQEYVDITNFYDPTWYLVSGTCMAAGFFLVWMGVFYWLASPKGKVLFSRILWVMSGIMLVNYMFFGTNIGLLNAELRYSAGMHFSVQEQILNVVVFVALIVVLTWVAVKFRKVVTLALLTMSIALSGMSVVNAYKIRVGVDQVMIRKDDIQQSHAVIPLSTTGQNVIVLMLDRGLAQQIPYIFNEMPHLKEQFDGFVFYENTLSFGNATNIASPALFGGYNYTPVEMNKDKSKSLVEKHNEALKVMPTVFAENDFRVTVIDPVYANYQWIPDTSIYEDIEGVTAYVAKGNIHDEAYNTLVPVADKEITFFCFSLMKTLPVAVQPPIYEGATGRHGQIQYSMSTSKGMNNVFLKTYNVLTHMDDITQVTDENVNTFLCMSNDTPHDPMLLQAPEYVPAEKVDNTQYDAEHADRFTLNGETLVVNDVTQMSHYHANMATMLRLGEYFDYLREQGVYDNTRIILASDHGRNLGMVPELVTGAEKWQDLSFYAPLLMVKDFGASGFETSPEFMTNADVPTLAFQNLITNPTLPGTDIVINSDMKDEHPQYVSLSRSWNTNTNNGNTYKECGWAVVDGKDLWNPDSWTLYEEERVLDEYSLH